MLAFLKAVWLWCQKNVLAIRGCVEHAPLPLHERTGDGPWVFGVGGSCLKSESVCRGQRTLRVARGARYDLDNCNARGVVGLSPVSRSLGISFCTKCIYFHLLLCSRICCIVDMQWNDIERSFAVLTTLWANCLNIALWPLVTVQNPILAFQQLLVLCQGPLLASWTNSSNDLFWIIVNPLMQVVVSGTSRRLSVTFINILNGGWQISRKRWNSCAGDDLWLPWNQKEWGGS